MYNVWLIIIEILIFQTKYYTEDSPSVLQNFQDLEEKRIKCIKNFFIKSVEVEREVLPIISQCLDCMEKSAESIDEKEVRLIFINFISPFCERKYHRSSFYHG